MNEHTDRERGKRETNTGASAHKQGAASGLAEEYSAELALPTAPRNPVTQSHGAERRATGAADWIGYAALLSALLSLAVYPLFFSGAAIVLGIFAYAGGRRKLGIYSIVIGLITWIALFILVPIYA